MGADGVVSFLQSYLREKADSEGDEGMRKYFAKWSPYRMPMTEGLEGDCKLVLKRETGNGRFSRAEKSHLEELGDVKVLDADGKRWKGMGEESSESEDEEVTYRKVTELQSHDSCSILLLLQVPAL